MTMVIIIFSFIFVLLIIIISIIVFLANHIDEYEKGELHFHTKLVFFEFDIDALGEKKQNKSKHNRNRRSYIKESQQAHLHSKDKHHVPRRHR